MKPQRDDLARKFLLGKLSDEDHTKIEEDFFNDNPSFENILITENELMDAYVTGSLSPDDRIRFEKRLLLTPQQKQRVEFAKTLVSYASSVPLLSEDLNSSAAKSKWLTLISQFFSAKPMFSFSFAALTLMFFASAIFWTINNSSPHFPHTDELAKTNTLNGKQVQENIFEAEAVNQEQKTLEKTEINIAKDNNSGSVSLPKVNQNKSVTKNQIPEKNQIPLTQKPPAIVSTVILSLGSTTRGEETVKAINIPVKADLVSLQLKFEEGKFNSYHAVLESVEGQQIWNGKMLKSVKSKNEKSVTLTIPSRLLKNGDYIVTLKGLNKDGLYETIGDYSLTVNRQ